MTNIKTCPYCHAEKFLLYPNGPEGPHYRECPICDGKGYTGINAGVCPRCRGKKMINGYVCETCNAKGMVKNTDCEEVRRAI